MEARQPFPIDDFPPEVLCRILMHLPPKDRVQCRLVSRKWSQLDCQHPNENESLFMKPDEFIARFKLCRLLCLIFDVSANWLANKNTFNETFSTLMKDSYYIFNVELLARQLVLLNEIYLFIKKYVLPSHDDQVFDTIQPLLDSLYPHASWESKQNIFNDFLNKFKTDKRKNTRGKKQKHLRYIESLINNSLTMFNERTPKEIFEGLNELFKYIDVNYKDMVISGNATSGLLAYRHHYAKDIYENSVIGTWLNHNELAKDRYLDTVAGFNPGYYRHFRTTHNGQTDPFFAPPGPRPSSITDSTIFTPYGPSFYLFQKSEYWLGSGNDFFERCVAKTARGGKNLGKTMHAPNVGETLGSIVGYAILFPPAFLVGVTFFISLMAVIIIVGITEGIIRGAEIGIKAVALGFKSLIHFNNQAKVESQPLLGEQRSSQYIASEEKQNELDRDDIESQATIPISYNEKEKEKEKEKAPPFISTAQLQENADDSLTNHVFTPTFN